MRWKFFDFIVILHNLHSEELTAYQMVDMIQPLPFPQMQTLLDAGFPDGNHNYWKSAFLREFGNDAIAILVQHANRAISPLSGVAKPQHFLGRINRRVILVEN